MLMVNVNTFKNEWISAKIVKFDSKQSGQVRVCFTPTNDKKTFRWVHLDNKEEVAPSEAKLKKTFARKRKRNEIKNADSDKDKENEIEIISRSPSAKKRKIKEDDFMPQLIVCCKCDKWRAILVKTENIYDWQPAPNWECQMNEPPFNKCSNAQATLESWKDRFTKQQLAAFHVHMRELFHVHIREQNYIKQTRIEIDELRKNMNQKNEKLKKCLKKELENKMKGMRENMKGIQTDNIQKSKELKSLQRKYDHLNRQNEENKRKLSLFNGDSQRMSSMNLQELDALDVKLQNVSTNLRYARERLLEDKLNCIVCLDSPKNIVIQSCGHFDMCKQCEESLETKICPRCQQPFDRVTVINH